MRIALAIGLILAAISQPILAASRYEGSWYIDDTTDNITGIRDVSALRLYLKNNEPDYVTLAMRCTDGKPTLFVEWLGQSFPDQTVFTIGPVVSPDADVVEKSFIFEKPNGSVKPELRASPEVSQAMISAIGGAKYATLTAHPSSGNRTIGLSVDGTQLAWSRVSRNCPSKVMPRPAE